MGVHLPRGRVRGPRVVPPVLVDPADDIVAAGVLEEMILAGLVGIPDVSADILRGDAPAVGHHAGGKDPVALDAIVVTSGDGDAVIDGVEHLVIDGMNE